MTWVVGVCVLAGVLSHAHPSLAQDPGECGYPADTPLPAGPTVTAQQVEDGRASLREFMLAARVRLMNCIMRSRVLESPCRFFYST